MKNQKIKTMSILIILIATIGISIAIVKVSKDIKGEMAVKNINWDIHFENLEPVKLKGMAKEVSKPYIVEESTSIMGIEYELQSGEDELEYIFDVNNSGSLDAKVSSIQVAVLKCEGIKKEDENLVCKNIKHELTYQDGAKINIGDILNAGERKKLKLKISYKGTQLPDNEVRVSNLNIALNYVQK